MDDAFCLNQNPQLFNSKSGIADVPSLSIDSVQEYASATGHCIT
jgi:hypothetical protein